MDRSIIKGLNDKLYDKRKATALELEKLVKSCVIEGDYARIDKIIDELCRDYTYALHQPMARNAGLMGLAATAIALGTNDVGKYLRNILPPVLACFGDQNDQVRFYACESLYNIAKIAKGEILMYFNEVFDVLCKISADTESSVRGAAELLDRLVKDIVAERAANYVSIVNSDPSKVPPAVKADPLSGDVYQETYEQDNSLAFSLPKFIPLLTERIYAINPDTRVFLVNWIKVLLNTPGIELISFLPSFLGGLFTFLGDSHKDVRVVTRSLMDSLLHEVNRIAHLQLDIKKRQLEKLKETDTTPQPASAKKVDGSLIAEKKKSLLNALSDLSKTEKDSSTFGTDGTTRDQTKSEDSRFIDNEMKIAIQEHNLISEPEVQELESSRNGEEYIPDQDIHLNFPDIISILINNLASSEPEIQLLSLHWINSILTIAPNDFIPFFSKILSLLLKLLCGPNVTITEVAHVINEKLLLLCDNYDHLKNKNLLNYGSIVNSLTFQFFDSKVDARLACLDWLSLIYRKAPDEILEHNDSMFLTLLKSLSENDPRLVEKALVLLQGLCSESNDNYLKKFLEDFITLLKRDPKLMKSRANYIMRKICASLSSERVFKVLSPILNTKDDPVFTRMLIQILSTNLVTAPEMRSLRTKLRCDNDPAFFNLLFKSWCCNPVSVISLGLISENYELVYSVLTAFANHELKLNDLIQLDVLVQLFESQVFTRMRLQLLEARKYPYLYKCLYGILMILPQSKAFDVLSRRLTSCNVWAPQMSNPREFIKQRNDSGYTTDSESSQRLVGQNKYRYEELLNYFNKVVSEEHQSMDSTSSNDIASIEIDNYLEIPDNKSFRSVNPLQSTATDPVITEISTPNHSFGEPSDTSSVIYKNENTSLATK
ncbi:Vac14p KNAG_0B06040 [Huiozyma naganishii CBS 8797]|uniref:Vacuolar protein 14 C-terminal Fig4-binding domain-containing protein n=1 Tax=Huiozyma naganishii (strain ATCC MYA-139 / BCRC 22969 / CBS 8797 / KCTC 17520 / NBRC 10181 / NCYC 3082 / Yp74L-3) TaxID=1071383 RepID=J7S427_HUIN7|nr:hypothetical protein KNAG_0B06040 [Kazachstania naganishii CBS 8797]CCK69034.1 hypothetical protein KNAG_0B06040 [Kazachstania naganishii CBS 8797]